MEKKQEGIKFEAKKAVTEVASGALEGLKFFGETTKEGFKFLRK